MFFQFSHDRIAFVAEPTKLGRLGIEIYFKVLFDESCDAKQPSAFGTALVMSCHCMRQVINCGGEVFAAIGFGEAGNSCESGAVLIHRLDKESAEFHREAMSLVGLAAIEAAHFTGQSLRLRKGRAGGEHDGAHGFFEVIGNGGWHLRNPSKSTARGSWMQLTDCQAYSRLMPQFSLGPPTCNDSDLTYFALDRNWSASALLHLQDILGN